MGIWPTCITACGRSGACVTSGRNCVRKSRVNESGNKRCTLIGIRSYLGTAIRAALVAAILVITPIGLAPVVSAHADTVIAVHRVPAAVRLRLAAWHWAMRQRYKPYIWGGTGPYGFDCSGLVYAAYRANGMRLPRTTYEMLGSWRLVRIPKWQARRGDLAFFGSGHVELYARGPWTFGAQEPGTRIGFHRMNRFWHPTMYFRIRD
jgi:NlpC/P60 family